MSGGWVGGAFGIGGSKEDRECTKRETVKSLERAVASGVYNDEQSNALGNAAFDILMNMREVQAVTTSDETVASIDSEKANTTAQRSAAPPQYQTYAGFNAR